MESVSTILERIELLELQRRVSTAFGKGTQVRLSFIRASKTRSATLLLHFLRLSEGMERKKTRKREGEGGRCVQRGAAKQSGQVTTVEDNKRRKKKGKREAEATRRMHLKSFQHPFSLSLSFSISHRDPLSSLTEQKKKNSCSFSGIRNPASFLATST